MSELNGELPKGWDIANFDEIVTNHDGRRVPLKSKDRESRKGHYRYYGASGVIDSIDDYLFDGDYLLVSEDGANLLSRTTPIAFQAHGQFWVNNHAHVVQPRDCVLVTFLEQFLNNFDLQEYVTGTAQPKLTQAALNRINVPIPPLAEQRRIVAAVEALLAQVNVIRDRLNRIPTLLKRFRQAILAAACDGSLTGDWRAQETTGWLNTTLESLVNEKPRNGYSPRPSEKPTNVKALTLTATTSGYFNPRYFKYLDVAIDSDSYLWLRPGDILIQRGNTAEYVGVSAIYHGKANEFIYPDLMMKVQVKEGIDPTYVWCALSDERVRNYFRENASGTAGSMPKINQRIVCNAPIQLPPLPEQHEIVRRVNALFALADQIESKLTRAKARVEKLTQAILAKAFRGELVTTEAELARRDGRDYESAEKLLERVRTSLDQRNSKQQQLNTKRKLNAARQIR